MRSPSGLISYHHQASCSPLHPIDTIIQTGAQATTTAPTTLGPPKSIALAIDLACALEIIVLQDPSAIVALQTARVEFLLPLALEVLSLDALVACAADAAV